MKEKKKSDSLNSSVALEDSGSALKVVMNISPTKGKKHEAYNVHSTKGISPTLRAQMGGACQGSQLILDVSGPTTSTNIPARSTGKGSEIKNSLKEISEISTQSKFLSLIFLQQDSPARVFPLLENAKVFRTEQRELFSLRSAGSLEIKDQASYSLRMLKDYFLMTKAEPLQLYSFHWMNLGMMQNGKCLTLNIGCPKTGRGSLSSVLEEKVDKKYYLSKRMIQGMIKSDFSSYSNNYCITLSPTIRTPGGGGHIPKVANTVDVDGYLRRGKRDRDKDGKAIQTSITDRRIRRLTPKECERLQGFPDLWTLKGIDLQGNSTKISDTQRYKMCGNAVSIPVITAIGNSILRSLLCKED